MVYVCQVGEKEFSGIALHALEILTGMNRRGMRCFHTPTAYATPVLLLFLAAAATRVIPAGPGLVVPGALGAVSGGASSSA